MVSGCLLAVPLVGWAQLEEIVVTTRKIAESIQDVPISVDAITSEQIERRGIADLSDVVNLSTSVQFDQAFGPQDTRIAVRGLSNSRGRSNVAFLVDGVDVTTENFISAGSGLLANQRLLTDVERIEIVKGPQSALYGRAAFAGAISYTTKEPTTEFESQVRLEAGNYGMRQVDGFISGPVAGLEDTLGFRWTGATWSRDGYYTNSTTGQDMGDEQGWGSALTMLLTPGNDCELNCARSTATTKSASARPSASAAARSAAPAPTASTASSFIRTRSTRTWCRAPATRRRVCRISASIVPRRFRTRAPSGAASASRRLWVMPPGCSRRSMSTR